VGVADTILVTTDGGGTWTRQASGTSGDSFVGVACPDAATCDAIGPRALVVATADGGATWARQVDATLAMLHGLACPAPPEPVTLSARTA